jgi:hypothetical protein
LAGRRKRYPSNLAKCLGLVPPDSLARPSPEQVQAYLNDMRALLKHPDVGKPGQPPAAVKKTLDDYLRA